jgi:hypothetical protein
VRKVLCLDRYRSLMRTRISQKLVAIVLFGGVAISACGSSGNNSGSKASGPPLTKAQFIQQADAICRRGNDKIDAQTSNLAPSVAPSDFITKTMLPDLRAEVDELRALQPPAADEATITKMLDNLSTGLDQFEKNAKSNPTTALQKPPQALKDAATAATAYGLKECGGSSSS